MHPDVIAELLAAGVPADEVAAIVAAAAALPDLAAPGPSLADLATETAGALRADLDRQGARFAADCAAALAACDAALAEWDAALAD